jgi:hypothetical protein
MTLRAPPALLLALVLVLAPSIARAQDTLARRSFTRGLVHYGKWATGAATVAFTVMAAHEHARANQASDSQQAAHYDRRARVRILGAQTSLLATAALVLVDLGRRTHGPGNKPFAPLEVSADPVTGTTWLELRFVWRLQLSALSRP